MASLKSYLKNTEMVTFFERIDRKSEIFQNVLKTYKSPSLEILNDSNFQTKIKCHFKNCQEVADTIIQKEIREEWEQRRKRLIQLSKEVDFDIYLEKNAKG